jgi:hypothetical protein
MRTVIIIPYFGKKLPVYFSLYLNSIEDNKDIDFMFFTDIEIREKTPPNFLVKKISIIEFNELTYDATGINPRISDYLYKLCDLKPLYGVIFQEYILDYDYWGFGDVDLIYGNLSDYLLEQVVSNKYDIISLRKEWLSGSTCFFKNIKEINELFCNSSDWQMVVENPRKHYGFDEVSMTTNHKQLYRRLEKGVNLNEVETEIESFTHVVRKISETYNVHFKSVICEKISRNMLLEFDNGRVIVHKKGRSDFVVGTEFLAYHYIAEKQTVRFKFPDWNQIPDKFYISRFGFHRSRKNIFLSIIIRWVILMIYRYPKHFSYSIFGLVRKVSNFTPKLFHYVLGTIGSWLMNHNLYLYVKIKRQMKIFRKPKA